jgi:DNA polymerase III alpha subunit
VNVSNAVWTIDRKKGAIRKGLSSIKGVGEKAAFEIAENKPYEDMEDFLERNGSRTVTGKPAFLKDGTWSGNLEKLKTAGALASLGYGRDMD